MWDLPGAGMELVSPALRGRFLSTAPTFVDFFWGLYLKICEEAFFCITAQRVLILVGWGKFSHLSLRILTGNSWRQNFWQLFLLASLFICFRCGHSAISYSSTHTHKIHRQRECTSSNCIVTNRKETLNNYWQMMDMSEMKPVTVQDAEKATASIKCVTLIQTLKRKIKSSMEHLTK